MGSGGSFVAVATDAPKHGEQDIDVQVPRTSAHCCSGGASAVERSVGRGESEVDQGERCKDPMTPSIFGVMPLWLI